MTEKIDLTEKLRLWGAAHAQARAAERAAAELREEAGDDARRQALSLRERADRLHRDIYGELGRGGHAR